MGQPIDRTGNFRGRIVDFGIQEYDTGSVAIVVTAAIDEAWNGASWDDWRESQVEVRGYLFIIKKDGTTNAKQVEALCKFADWDGTISSVENKTWVPKPCSFLVGEKTYNDVTTFQISFINDYESSPGAGLARLGSDRIKQLEARFGSSLRAIAGNCRTNDKSPPPTGKPKLPPKPQKEKVPNPVPDIQDDIPF